MPFREYITHVQERLERLQQLDLNDPKDRAVAERESLEILRAITRYRGLIKNMAELVAAREGLLQAAAAPDSVAAPARREKPETSDPRSEG